MRNPTPLKFEDDYPFEETSKKTAPKPQPSSAHGEGEFTAPSTQDAASLSEYRLLIIRHIRNNYFMKPYLDTFANLCYFMPWVINLHEVIEVSRSHDIIDEFKLIVNNLSTIVESMQDMMRVFIPDGMMTFRRDQWDRWTLLDMTRAVVEDKSLNSISRSTSCAKLLSTIMPIELADEMFQAYQIEIDDSKDFNRMESWSKFIAVNLKLNLDSDKDVKIFFTKMKFIPNDQILLESKSRNNRFLEQKNRIVKLVSGSRDIFATWTRKVNSLHESKFNFSLFYMDNIRSGDPSVQPKKLELKQPILDKVLYSRDLEKEEFLQIMFLKTGYSLYDTRTDMNALIKRLSQQIGLLLTDLLYLFKSKTETLATVFLTEEVLQAILKKPFCKNADALFTIKGERPVITLYCIYSGRHSTYEILERRFILSKAKYRHQETFVLGPPSIVCWSDIAYLGERKMGLHGIPGEVIIVCRNEKADKNKNLVTNLNLITKRNYCICLQKSFYDEFFIFLERSEFILITQLEGSNDLLVCNNFLQIDFFLLQSKNHDSGRLYKLIRYENFNINGDQNEAIDYIGTFVYSKVYRFQENSSMLLMIHAGIRMRIDPIANILTLSVIFRIRVIDTEYYFAQKHLQLYREEETPILKIDHQAEVIQDLVSNRTIPILRGYSFDDAASIIIPLYKEANFKYLGNLSRCDTEPTSHNYLIFIFNKGDYEDQLSRYLIDQLPVAFKLKLPGDLAKKVWKQFKEQIVDWEPAHFGSIPFHALS